MENRQYSCGPASSRYGAFYNNAPVNISETDAGYTVQLYAPALQKEAIAITTQNDVLTIRYSAAKEPDGLYTRREYRPDAIHRTFDLKGKVVIEGIKASYTEGILKIELPKTDAAKQPLQEVPVR